MTQDRCDGVKNMTIEAPPIRSSGSKELSLNLSIDHTHSGGFAKTLNQQIQESPKEDDVQANASESDAAQLAVNQPSVTAFRAQKNAKGAIENSFTKGNRVDMNLVAVDLEPPLDELEHILSYIEGKYPLKTGLPSESGYLSNPLEPPELNVSSLIQTKESLLLSTDTTAINRVVIPTQKIEATLMTQLFADPQWENEIAERVVVMIKQHNTSAEMRLNPQHLGLINIKLDVHKDQVMVTFATQNTAVKEALELTAPKLRDMLASEQLNLLDMNVSQDQQMQQSFDDNNLDTHANRDDNMQSDIVDEIETSRAIADQGVLSVFV